MQCIVVSGNAVRAPFTSTGRRLKLVFATPPGQVQVTYVDTPTLVRILRDGDEYALLDVRERGRYATGHPLAAINLPLSRLELNILRYVPRKSSRVILCDDGEGLAQRATDTLIAGGYTDVSVLEGGVTAWRSAGQEVFRGHYAVTYAFGLFIEQHYGTPSISADELKTKLDNNEPLVLVDARPIGEVGAATIPGARSVPFSELAYRVRDLLPDDKTTLVVHCGAVTRGVLGTESLIEAGLGNPLLMVSNGVRGWAYAGHELERGCERVCGPVSANSLAFSEAARARVTENLGVKFVSKQELEVWQAERDTRTLHLVDIRSEEEYVSGHIAGSISVIGSELVGLYEDHIGTLNARVCLVDDNGCRAATVASWLTRLGWQDVVVLEQGLAGYQLEVGHEVRETLVVPGPDCAEIGADKVAELIANDETVVVDFSSSAGYHKAHIPGAWWSTRAYLAQNANLLPNVASYVVTAADPELARLAARDLSQHCDKQVFALIGGNNAWGTSGRAYSSGPGRVAGAVEDIPTEFLAKPNDDHETARSANKRNLEWQHSLLEKIARDQSFSFPSPPPRSPAS